MPTIIPAQKVLRLDSNYKIQVPSNGKIYLDTGNNVGEVYITGDLTVQGNTTTVNTTNMLIEDNIILLNKGETGSGVTETTAGIEIDRGSATRGNSQILWDESRQWRDPTVPATISGAFVFKTKTNGQLSGIVTNSITTEGGDLGLISDGTGVITVTGTVNYEEQVINYGNVLEAIDDDTIPNIKAVIDKINYSILNSPSDKIRRDDTQVIVYDKNLSGSITSFDTSIHNPISPTSTVRVYHFLTTNKELNVKVSDKIIISGSGVSALNGTFSVSSAGQNDQYFDIDISPATAYINNLSSVATVINDGQPGRSNYSNARIEVDGEVYGEFINHHANIFDVRISDTTIMSLSSNTDLILASPGTGSVQVQDNLKIKYIGSYGSSSVPAIDYDAVKIYTDVEGPGQTGIYFINHNYNDELISKKKAIAFSILM